MGVEIRIEGLTKSFGSQLIWGDVTLTVPPGEICVMLGPSGTGKSVLLKTLIGLLKPDSGSVVIEGVDITTCPEKQLYEVRKLFGVLFQDGAMFGSMNLYDNVAFPLREHTRKSESEIRSVVMEKMDLVGLLGAEDKLPGEISGGMRKRAGLARALALDPELLFLDEPTAGLDPIGASAFDRLTKELQETLGLTVFLITHDLDTLYEICDRVAVLADRKVIAVGTIPELLAMDHPWIQEYFNGPRGRAARDAQTRGS